MAGNWSKRHHLSVNKQHKRALHSLDKSSGGLRHRAEPGTGARSLEMSICVWEWISHHPCPCWGWDVPPVGATAGAPQSDKKCWSLKSLLTWDSLLVWEEFCSLGWWLSSLICPWPAATAHLTDGLTKLQLLTPDQGLHTNLLWVS